MSKESISWPHAPTHQLALGGTYFLTCSTYLKQHFFRGSDRLAVLQRGLLKVTAQQGWHLEAWAIFSNHYHFVAHSPSDQDTAESLRHILSELHRKTALWANHLDRTPGRRVWFNYWESRLTFHRSYLARLNYVHQNPVKHGLVWVANQYPWCSARWFERMASAAQIKSLYRIKVDQVNVVDEYEPDPHW